MKRLSFHTSLAGGAAVAALSTLVACGGISDPTKSGERVATVSGALTGTNVPSGTRVALVWRVGVTGERAVGSDVPVVDGKFEMDLSVPPANYFFPVEGEEFEDIAEPPPVMEEGSSGSTSSSSGSTSASGDSSGASKSYAFANKLAPRDTVSGQITSPLTAAFAGFVVYVDTNGNGKLDISGPSSTSTDQVIGGNRELVLTYLRDGGALDYEKLRDRSSILPSAGYNVMWGEGRWLSLNAIELKLGSNARLPSAVCVGASSGWGSTGSSSGTGGDGSSGTSSSDGPAVPEEEGTETNTNGPYPSPNDPALECHDDGYSYSYVPAASNCELPAPSAPPAEGLCSPVYKGTAPMPCGTSSAPSGGSIPHGSTPPQGWPCPITETVDAGSAPDAGG